MLSPAQWSYPPPDVTLSFHDLHIWRASLFMPDGQMQQFWPLLSSDERVRAGRFHFEQDKDLFVMARGLLRVLIGRYLEASPDQLQFEYSDYGKPSLVPIPGTDPLQFNVTHSQDMAIFAFCREGDVGVDVEKLRPLPNAQQIAARFFSDYENAIFNSLPKGQRDEAFFNCWTRKEAFIKAVGEGLSYPLGQFDVTLTPGHPVRLVRIQGREQEAAGWSLYGMQPAPGYIGAVAVSGRNWKLSRWRWSEADEEN